MCPNFGTPKMINFPFGTNGKFIMLGVPVLKHITVHCLPNFYGVTLAGKNRIWHLFRIANR